MKYVEQLVGVILLLSATGIAAEEQEIAMKLLVVNPSETEVKEFNIRSPLPPEVKPEHVVSPDGFHVEYDSQAGVHMLVGSVTLKPKEAISRKILLQDVWVVPRQRLEQLRGEVLALAKRLAGTPYEAQGQLLIGAIERNLGGVEISQAEPFTNPQQHISLYRENMKTLQLVESDLVSLRQLMVMASLYSPKPEPVIAVGGQGTGNQQERGSLSVLATWRLIFIILGLLGFVSLTFFLIWQRQLRLQLAKQPLVDEEPFDPVINGKTNGHGTTPSASLPPTPLPAPLQPKSPLSS